MIFMARSSHLGQVLLRDRMLLPALFLDLDAAHASAEEMPKRGFNSNRPWPAAVIVGYVSTSGN